MKIIIQIYISNGEKISIPLKSGDIYIMSEKATGNDWKKTTIATLRHATGCKKFVTLKTIKE